ncbi:putative TetR family transcriptional regulator [Gordonia effusa NBRC 100432]|uniref:Putative TetR family transcriptional regulator n=1 Tax=Gordonia effusa NBRC 100432 TaxID=1077974 RepID=H0QY24_9ACTN|nr:TetR family transcriptional regulator [Gordonia effusa]GAB17725.1 putative TetR family transcriptional regulator [Gordonia effusa NBRC 100432]
MRSVDESDDRTARARLRDAAIEVFARDGFGATVRTIASTAQVSPGLVIHHFGSKAGLQAECDSHVLASLFDANRDILTGTDAYNSFLAKLQHAESSGTHVVYMLRAVQQGGETARAFLERMVAESADSMRIGVANGQIRPSVDEAGRARYLTMVSIGALLLDTVMHPPPDWSDSTAILRGYIDRVAVAGTEMAVHGVLLDSAVLDAAIMARQELLNTSEDNDDQSR